MSLDNVLQKLRAARTKLNTSVQQKGVDIPDNSTLYTIDKGISMIPQGSGSNQETYVAVSVDGVIKMQKLSFQGGEAIAVGSPEDFTDAYLFPTPAIEEGGDTDEPGDTYEPEVTNETPLTFTAVTARSTVALRAIGSPNVAGLKYSLNKGKSWETYTVGTVITLVSKDDCVQFKNTENTLSVDFDNHARFAMAGKISASGNIQSMLNFREDCTSYCYYRLFDSCKELITAPDLPATTLAIGCYQYMFAGCTSLVNAPDLPATTLVYDCYAGMFYDCTSLITAPELPATTLAIGCYKYMFSGCTSLVNAPDLPATTLANICYSGMFINCTSLSTIRVAFMDWNGTNTSITRAWTSDTVVSTTSGVSSSGVFYKPSALPEEYGVDRIPEGWTVVNID